VFEKMLEWACTMESRGVMYRKPWGSLESAAATNDEIFEMKVD
jgi:hypothetical protein